MTARPKIVDAGLRAKILSEALPYIRAFNGKTIVIKYGGSAQVASDLKEGFAQDIVLLKYVGIRPVIVHGGGEQVSDMMEKLGKDPKFVDGLRVTDPETMEVVEMVLGGRLNKEIVARINKHGGSAVGLTGKDGRLMQAVKKKPKRLVDVEGREKLVDLGLVGDIEKIDSRILEILLANDFIPVVAPVGVTADGVSLNVNADTAAGSIAAALRAARLIYLTDVPGLLKDEKDDDSLISTVRLSEVDDLREAGVISGGMIPKIESVTQAIYTGVEKAHFIDGRVPRSLLLELFTDEGIGTEIIQS
ncbi:MAG: acetylglutamate kinase [Candidatus Lindowbacteria bacterium RIFCSPLOWO2_12_FULL_62_27]|nr:MAG: acetylglutamate kinase [Candidatus Lindowbacteria bacterium RIFCSPLOWO2_12_FULL_62_27]